jgi:hypothetical protein
VPQEEHVKVYQKKQFDETNRWSLFPEENKKSDNGPDYTGEVDIGGTKYRLARLEAGVKEIRQEILIWRDRAEGWEERQADEDQVCRPLR